MKKNLFFIVLLAVISFVLTVSAGAVTLYAPDGRTIDVIEEEVEAYINVGWYKVPVTAVYTSDGRSAVIACSELDVYKALGWNDTVTVYAPDGRSANVSFAVMKDYLALGWYKYPVVNVYSTDGEKNVIAVSELEQYKAAGWVDSVTLYASDGKIVSVIPPEVDDYIVLGWSKEPFFKMYSFDGRSVNVKASQVTAYESVGWYKDYNDVVQMLYADDGRTVTVFKSQVATYLSLGWRDVPVNVVGSYYPGTTVPTYTVATGVALQNVYCSESGVVRYVYPATKYSGRYQLYDYVGYFRTSGWLEQTSSGNYGSDLVWVFRKDDNEVMIRHNGSNNIISARIVK